MGSSSMWMTLLVPSFLVAAMLAPITVISDCHHRCGIDEHSPQPDNIPYPFGFGTDHGCFRPGFEASCINDSISIIAGTGTSLKVRYFEDADQMPVARVLVEIARQCFSPTGDIVKSSKGGGRLNPEGVYRISTNNELVVVGCNTSAYIDNSFRQGSYQYNTYKTGCVAFADANETRGLQDGTLRSSGCCSVTVPPELTDSVLSFENGTHDNLNLCPCDYAFITYEGNYHFQKDDLRRLQQEEVMPMDLDWAIRDNGSCPANGQAYACLSVNSNCLNSTNGPGYSCYCDDGYYGNPYVIAGCIDRDECEDGIHAENACKGKCKNTDGSFECYCSLGYRSSYPITEECKLIIPLSAQISIGISAGIFLIIIMSFLHILRKEKRHRDEIYRKNGGPTLEKASIIKLFRKEELIQILKPSNIIGKGGFGEVYRGLLDGVWVAIKKPINGNQMETGQFANEVIIQSKVIHKNIVRLIGCCLEVDTPMLVYEFISQGSMDDILHGEEKKHLGLDARLSIAAESAQGLAYMHSQTNTVILHGDVKPANILLDEKFSPKISDFGISRLIARDNEHTASVIGDKTYMDPVYLESGLLTAKSDVYSFGVVILELISRKKATHIGNSNLVNSFLENHKKGEKSIELFDTEILEGAEDLLQSLTELAMKCLHLEVDQRPTMTEVAEQLVAFTRFHQT